MDIAGFLGRYSPFADLSPESLRTVASSVEIEHVAAGETILRQEGEPAAHLYVVRKGAVELLDGDLILDVLGEGEVFGAFSLLAQDRPSLTVRAAEDMLCYLIPDEVAQSVLGTSAGRSFVIGSMRRRIRAISDRAQEETADPAFAPVRSLVRRPAVTVPPETSIADAAGLMARERVSSLLLGVNGSWAIVTDRDLRTKVVAARGDVERPVESIATRPVETIADDSMAAEALLEMFAKGIHHLPVVDATGSIVGVVTDTDLMGLGRHTPFAIRSALERARTRDEIVAAALELPDVVTTLVDSSADPVAVGKLVTMTLDAATTRLLQLGIDRLGEPPAAWAWLALGSGARREQALATDQDHALVHAATAGDADAYFAELAGFVTDGLADAGVPRCKGDAMAVHPTMRGDLDTWIGRVVGWMDDLSPRGSLMLSIVLDYRRVAGPLEVDTAIEQVVRSNRLRPGLVERLARRALDLKPPTGFFRDLVVEHDGEHRGALDVKHGGLTIVSSIARALSVRSGLSSKDTLGRLEGAAGDIMSDADAEELGEAFRFLWETRLRHQSDQVRAGETPDDFVRPATLGPVARQGLKESFRVVERAQRQLSAELGIVVRR